MRAFLEEAVAQIESEAARVEIWRAVEAALAKANAA
jgi:hypothetical protein